jgi:hypothetical protein
MAGSIAAGVQSGIGNVAAGSAFAALQSAGTMPLFTGAIGAAAGGGAAVIGRNSKVLLKTVQKIPLRSVFRGR